MPLMSKFDAEHELILVYRLYLQTYRHDMTYSVLKVPLNPNQPVYRLHLEWMNVDIPNLIHKLRHIQASRR